MKAYLHSASRSATRLGCGFRRRLVVVVAVMVSLMVIDCGSTAGAPPEPEAQIVASAQSSELSVKTLYNLDYSPNGGPLRKCDVYLPADHPGVPGQDDVQAAAAESIEFTDEARASKSNALKRPVVVVVHGGGWSSGDKWTMGTHCKRLARLGCVVVNINYRLAPADKFPRQVDDVREALVWVADKADEFAIDLTRLGLFGYSAGGHLVALLGVLQDEPLTQQCLASEWTIDDPRWSRLPKPLAICSGGPPCDFQMLPPQNTTLAYFLGGSRSEKPEAYRIASPVAFASGGEPSFQIIHGETDMIVPISSSRRLSSVLNQKGIECRFEEIPGQGHVLTFLHPKTLSTLETFFRDQLVEKE